MSSTNNDPDSGSPPAEKRKRIARACDTCRRRKIKCDVDAVPGVRCQRCTDTSLSCTWDDEVKKRGRKRRVDALEDRLKTLEATLVRQTALLAARAERNAEPISTSPRTPDSFDVEDASEDDPEIRPLLERVSRLELSAVNSGVFGLSTSTGRNWALRILELRTDVTPGPESVPFNPDPWELEEATKWKMRRRHFNFPPPDLLPLLIQAYMDYQNIYLPLFHVPTFQAAVHTNHLHHHDPDFAVVLLLVCAIGSRFVDDPRVVLPGAPRRSAGWMWYNQCDISRPDILSPPTLYRMQSHVLASIYAGGAFNAILSWMLTAMVLRSMQEMGVHRKRVFSTTANVEDELWKRCFWVCATTEVIMASETGRPPFLTDETFDIPLPIECDDEFWHPEDPADAFRQPSERPSHLAYFVHHCKLEVIHMKAMRTLFSVKAESETRTAAMTELERDLNEWVDTIPSHLEWGIAQQYRNTQDVFFLQAARLRLEYNYLLIVLHRPFVQVRKYAAESANSFAICTQAARAIASVLGFVENKITPMALAITHIFANNACVVLILARWGAREMNIQIDENGVSRDIQRCLDALAAGFNYFRHAQGLHRLLSMYASRGDSTGPSAHAPPSRKRSATEMEVGGNTSWSNVPNPNPFVPLSTSFAAGLYNPLAGVQTMGVPYYSAQSHITIPGHVVALHPTLPGSAYAPSSELVDNTYVWSDLASHPSNAPGLPPALPIDPQRIGDEAGWGNDLLELWQTGNFLDPSFDSRSFQ